MLYYQNKLFIFSIILFLLFLEGQNWYYENSGFFSLPISPLLGRLKMRLIREMSFSPFLSISSHFSLLRLSKQIKEIHITQFLFFSLQITQSKHGVKMKVPTQLFLFGTITYYCYCVYISTNKTKKKIIYVRKLQASIDTI